MVSDEFCIRKVISRDTDTFPQLSDVINLNTFETQSTKLKDTSSLNKLKTLFNLDSIHFCLAKNYCIEVVKQRPLKLCVRVSQATTQRKRRVMQRLATFVRCPRQGGTVSKSIQSCGISTSWCWWLLVIPKVDGEVVSREKYGKITLWSNDDQQCRYKDL